MDLGVWIFRDDEFDEPLYADPDAEDVEVDGLWEAVCEHVLEAFDGDGSRFDTADHGKIRVGWKVHGRSGVTFVVAAPTSVGVADIKQFLTDLSQRYMDEVDSPRFPELSGVEDVVVDVIPPWEE